MSNVIQLNGREGAKRPTPLPDGASAEILIFHGVRFERLADDAAPTNRRLPTLHNQATAEELE